MVTVLNNVADGEVETSEDRVELVSNYIFAIYDELAKVEDAIVKKRDLRKVLRGLKEATLAMDGLAGEWLEEEVNQGY